ncbi:MAG: polysaccharide biosynthesis protein, partial [Actinobacteria bacterium]|nr:polysaccharide biosynthesis protein [Actinomycetota bacterium]
MLAKLGYYSRVDVWRIVGRILRRPGPLAAFDTLLWFCAIIVSLSIRYVDFHDGPPRMGFAWGLAASILTFHSLAFGSWLYRRRYRLGSKEEVIAVTRVTIGTSAIVTLGSLLWPGQRPLPISASILAGLLALLGMLAGRTAIRASKEHERRSFGEPALVFGLGVAGMQILETMLADPESPYTPVGLLDDDKFKQSMRLRGLKCYGGLDDIKTAALATGATTLIVAVVTGQAEFYQHVSYACSKAGLDVKIVPPLSTLLQHSGTIRDLNDITITDLLGRREIETDLHQIAGYLRNRRVLVTGAGGSIGSELCRQLNQLPLAELIMVDRDESALHGLQLSLHNRALLDTPDVVLLDIRDSAAVSTLFAARKPHVVFHAAALKHLPMLEQYPDEAWKTNVLGSRNVIEAAAATQVEVFVNISTDKAANPTSVLGFSKRIAERLTTFTSQTSQGRYVSVRFGNVLGSRGSVLTSFTDQIAKGGPVTVTDPAVTRFFMTISEAVQLTLQAAAIGESGTTLVLDMGSPVRIVDIARQMIVLSKRHIDITFTGLRPGEKLDEELFDLEEHAEQTDHPLISAVRVQELAADGLDSAYPTFSLKIISSSCLLYT